jgi:hypothetical protein
MWLPITVVTIPSRSTIRMLVPSAKYKTLSAETATPVKPTKQNNHTVCLDSRLPPDYLISVTHTANLLDMQAWHL